MVPRAVRVGEPHTFVVQHDQEPRLVERVRRPITELDPVSALRLDQRECHDTRLVGLPCAVLSAVRLISVNMTQILRKRAHRPNGANMVGSISVTLGGVKW